MKIVKAASYNVEFGSLIESNFSNLLREKYSNSKKIIFVDDNTHEHCLDYLITNFEELENAEIILLPAGEENKVMEVCFQVWEALSEYKISRKDLIINLGGGVVCDMGGFIASIFKRGIDFIQIPTTLLAMVDASVGGKTGIDLGRYKNQLGVFANPQAIYIDPCLLQTLEEKELKNGLAEMLKHGLIVDKNHWEKVKNIDVKEITLENILHSVEIKNNVVLADPKEIGERKKLNFGHTFGHAFEGFLLHSEEQIAHGHAVALGIICESYLSHQKGYLKEEELNEICEVIADKFQLLAFQEEDFNALYEL
jgi:3-dehydroquinate synthase